MPELPRLTAALIPLLFSTLGLSVREVRRGCVQLQNCMVLKPDPLASLNDQVCGGFPVRHARRRLSQAAPENATVVNVR